MDLHDLMVRDPAVCGGDPVFRGTRVTLRTVLASLADGDSVEQVVRSFPTLTARNFRPPSRSRPRPPRRTCPCRHFPPSGELRAA